MNKEEKKARKHLIDKARENRPSKFKEEDMLENNSYYDVDMIENANAPIKREINYWEKVFKPSGNMGKWWQSTRIQSLKNKLYKYKDK